MVRSGSVKSSFSKRKDEKKRVQSVKQIVNLLELSLISEKEEVEKFEPNI